jgi:hypothetical protein
LIDLITPRLRIFLISFSFDDDTTEPIITVLESRTPPASHFTSRHARFGRPTHDFFLGLFETPMIRNNIARKPLLIHGKAGYYQIPRIESIRVCLSRGMFSHCFYPLLSLWPGQFGPGNLKCSLFLFRSIDRSIDRSINRSINQSMVVSRSFHNPGRHGFPKASRIEWF